MPSSSSCAKGYGSLRTCRQQEDNPAPLSTASTPKRAFWARRIGAWTGFRAGDVESPTTKI
eukprot:scaffold2927_cov143-Cylindrotheca_fusiformis.AAC.7